MISAAPEGTTVDLDNTDVQADLRKWSHQYETLPPTYDEINAYADDLYGTPLDIANPTTAFALQITQTGNTSSSTTTGGAMRLVNTGNSGLGALFYSNHASPSGRLVAINAANAGFTQSALRIEHAGSGRGLDINQTGTGIAANIVGAGGASTSAHALAVSLSNSGSSTSSALSGVSANTAHSAVQVTGVESGRGTIKVTHTGTGGDTNASGLSIDLQGTGTAAQGIFIDATEGGTTGKLLNIRNNGVDRLVMVASGDVTFYDTFKYSNLRRNIFNVKDYGAVGNGSTNDTTAIAAAITAATSTGGEVYFPPGTYQVASTLTIPSKVRLVGAGKNVSIIRKSASIANAMLDFTGTNNSTRCQRGGMADIQINGAGSNGAGTFTGPLVRCKWADHLNFDRVWFNDNIDQALNLENCWDSYWNDCEFEWCSGTDGLKPSVLIRSNSDDSSNILVFNNCRWEAFRDGALWMSTAAMVSAYTPVAGSNPVYGIYLQNCKMETSQLRGLMIDMSNDVGAVHVDGMYMSGRGLASGISTGRNFINCIGLDMTFKRMRVNVQGVTNPTCDSVFRVFTSGKLTVEEITVQDTQALNTGIFNWAGGLAHARVNHVGFLDATGTVHGGNAANNPVNPTIASAATITVPHYADIATISGTTNITSVTATRPGHRITLVFSGILTFTDGSNLKLATNFTTAADATITLVCNGTNWYELSRSTN